MSIMQLITLLLIVIIAILAGLSCFLFLYSRKMRKACQVFFKNGNLQDAKELLLSQLDATKEVQEKLHQAFNQIADLQKKAKVSLQKVGVVRFNPFGDMGGNQSFCIALLDQENNGFVISSLFTQEENRVYSKAIKNALSEHALSKEEKEAIDQAMGRFTD